MSTEPRRTAERRQTAVVQYNGASYTRNLSLYRRALTEQQVEGNFLVSGAKLDHLRWSRVAAWTVTWPARETEDGDPSLP